MRPTDPCLPQPAPSGRGPRRRAVLGGALFLGAAGFSLSPAAAAAADQATPRIADCASWGARPPKSPVEVLAHRPDKVLVHHTATPNSADQSQAHAFVLARSIQNHHLDNNGWIDSGQHFTISRGGHITEGRHRSLETLLGRSSMITGAHCPGQNTIAIGIENEGTYSSVEPPSALYSSLVDMCAYICTQYGLPPYQIYGHRDFTNTLCPGDRLYAMLPKLRRDVAAQVGGNPTAPFWPVVRVGTGGGRVRTVQYLLRRHGGTPTLNGAYDSATVDAVKAFQRSVRALPDGVTGNQTWNQLVEPLARGSSGDAVRAAQSQLAAHGARIAVDGAFGPATASAVTSFQSTHSLPADGAVDARTWSVLVT